MIHKIDIKILELLSEREQVTISTLVKELHKTRTTLLSHLENLESKGLIEKIRLGRKNFYQLASTSKITSYFDNQKKEIELTERKIMQLTKNRKIPHRKLTLSIVNYFDLLPEYRAKLEKFYNIKDFSNKQLLISYNEFLFRARDADVVINNGGCRIREMINLPNVVVTPHIAGVTEESVDKLGETVVNNVKNFLQGDNTNCVNCRA